MALLSDYFTEDQLAEELGVTTRTLRNWRLDKKGPPVTELGNKRIYHVASVTEWLKSREKEAAA